MRITHISTAVIESNFDWTIVKVETDENITGYGEAFLGPGLTAVIAEFAAILKGEDPTSIDRVLRRMRASCVQGRHSCRPDYTCQSYERESGICWLRSAKR